LSIFIQKKAAEEMGKLRQNIETSFSHKVLKDNPAYECFEKSPCPSVKHSSYFFAYNDLLGKFRGREITFIEIGVLGGGSLFMWREFLGRDARIIGIDLNPSALSLKNDGFEIYIGNQANPSFWRELFADIGPVDVVLDDGGHTYEQQVITAHECIPNINDGGMLIIEDTHTSYFQDYGYPSRYSFIEWAKGVIDRINARHRGVATSRLKPDQIIYSVQFFDSIVCLNVDRSRCLTSEEISNNKGDIINLDFRHNDSIVSEAHKISAGLSKNLRWVKRYAVASRILNITNVGFIKLITMFSAWRRNSRLKQYFN
jgi:hypothetical protein